MKKRLLAALMASSLMLSLAACGGSDTNTSAQGETGTEAQDGPYQISMVLKTNAAEFWQVIQAGAEAYEEEHPDLVSLDIKGPPGETFYEEQLNMIQTDLALESYDGYLIAPLQSDAVATAIANTDMAMAAARTAADNPAYANTIFLGFDGQQSACQAVLDGELTMTAAQNNFDIGYQAVETIVKILQGEDYDEVVDTGTEIITQDNAADRLARFDEWLA